MPPKPNTRSTAIKRILQEVQEFERDPPQDFVAHPLEDDLFDWHITMKGAEGSDYEGGIYHARLTLPPTYPLTPPDIQIHTPSGRFETQKNICIDGITSFHTGSWRPIWGIRTVVVGLGGFWNVQGVEAEGGYGGLKMPGDERRRLAKASGDYVCKTCGKSNREIMREHEETVRMKEEQRVEAVSLVPETQGKRREGDEDAETIKDKVEQETITGQKVVDTSEAQIGQSDPRGVTPPATSTSSTTTTVRQHPPLTSIQRALLHPWLSHGLLPSPFKLYIHLLRLVFISGPTLEAYHHPTNLDGLLLLDTLIWVIGMVVILILGPKLGETLRKISDAFIAFFSRRTGAVGVGGAGGLEVVKRLRRAPQAARSREHVHPRRNGIRTEVRVGANDAVPVRQPGAVSRDAGGARMERRAAGAVAGAGTGGV